MTEIVRSLESTTCAPLKVDLALIARFRPATFGYFWPIFFFADHSRVLAQDDQRLSEVLEHAEVAA